MDVVSAVITRSKLPMSESEFRELIPTLQYLLHLYLGIETAMLPKCHLHKHIWELGVYFSHEWGWQHIGWFLSRLSPGHALELRMDVRGFTWPTVDTEWNPLRTQCSYRSRCRQALWLQHRCSHCHHLPQYLLRQSHLIPWWVLRTLSSLTVLSGWHTESCSLLVSFFSPRELSRNSMLAPGSHVFRGLLGMPWTLFSVGHSIWVIPRWEAEWETG